jgi:hypothetical protein
LHEYLNIGSVPQLLENDLHGGRNSLEENEEEIGGRGF